MGNELPPLGARGRQRGRRNVSETTTLSSSAAGRYATALFELALEEGALEEVERDINALADALDASDDLRTLISSPIYSREEQGRALAAVASSMGLGALASNVVALMASKRRLFVLPEMISIFQKLLAEHRGEVSAEVVSARPLSDAQAAALTEKLKAAIGREVKLKSAVDEDLIAGLVVKVGSRMIDTSISAKLNALKNAMREVG
jgi:F-type H+-transporting ATPase subunit delta